MIKKYISRFPHALRGLKRALLDDFGFRTQILLGLLVALFVYFFLLPLDKIDLLFLALAYILILITELQNSALESALDKLHPELHENIKQSKDMAAGAVLVAGVFFLIVLLTVIYNN